MHSFIALFAKDATKAILANIEKEEKIEYEFEDLRPLIIAVLARAVRDAAGKKDDLKRAAAREWLIGEELKIYTDALEMDAKKFARWVGGGCPKWDDQALTIQNRGAKRKSPRLQKGKQCLRKVR